MQAVTGLASKFMGRRMQGVAESYEPDDPYYEYYDDKGKRKRRRLPPGLTKKEAKILRKVLRRAHYLDQGVNLCGFRVGWTFFIGIIPFAGTIVDGLLSYHLVTKKAQEIDNLPQSLVAKMYANNSVSIGLNVVPVIGDLALAVWRTNWRNANLLEKYMRERGAAALGQTQPHHGVFDFFHRADNAAASHDDVTPAAAQAPPLPQRATGGLPNA
ncbi:hypothetical protein MSPP1_000830 [Malassezia sp. CBS 17886]|nr:hypothetical protein MSPP1_000830 [Malassezia sp. CBS 17886]